jgi:hypothetical protein
LELRLQVPFRAVVSPGIFAVTLAVGAAVLALWMMVRFSRFGPSTVMWALLNVIAACVLLQVLLPTAMDAIGASGFPAAIWVSVFGVALPLLIYAFLSGGWMMRAAMSLLR